MRHRHKWLSHRSCAVCKPSPGYKPALIEKSLRYPLPVSGAVEQQAHVSSWVTCLKPHNPLPQVTMLFWGLCAHASLWASTIRISAVYHFLLTISKLCSQLFQVWQFSFHFCIDYSKSIYCIKIMSQALCWARSGKKKDVIVNHMALKRKKNIK